MRFINIMSSRKQRADTLVDLIKNEEFGKIKDQLSLVFARKIATKVQRKEQDIILSLKSKNIKG